MDDNKSFTISVYNDYNDNDSDGLNNYAEAQNGTDLNNTDSDGDGSNDYFEWVAGTDPNNASAHFKIQNFVIDQETFQLEYDSNFGRNYNILVSSDLNTWTEWKTLSGDGEKQITIFNNQEKINLGIDSTSKIYFFKVDIIKID